MTNKKFKLAAMSLATAVAVSSVGPSASAVTYQLENGDVTVAENENGAFSYQNTANGKTDDVYVDKDTQDYGQIIIKQAEGTTTDNTVTVEENVTNKDGDRAKEDKKTIIKVGEGADVDLTVKDSKLTTGGHGIDIGVDLDGKDGGEDGDKKTNVDLTLDNTQINLTQNGKAGINVQDNSNVDLTLKDKNTIDGSEAIKKEEDGILTKNVNVEGIRVGDGGGK